nr:fatty acid desaturase [uncultured Pseudodesulfovibrio sp.]
MSDTHKLSIQDLRTLLKPFAKPNFSRAIWQIMDTYLPYFGLWGLLIYLLKNETSFFLIFPLLILAALLLVRIFIIFHDCAHGSFFTSRRANIILGFISGFLTFTPFTYWQRNHLIRHLRQSG